MVISSMAPDAFQLLQNGSFYEIIENMFHYVNRQRPTRVSTKSHETSLEEPSPMGRGQGSPAYEP